MCAGFAARRRSSLNCRELHWTAPGKLAAVQPSPWLYRPTHRGKRQRNRKATLLGERETNPEKEGGTWAAPQKHNKQIQRARAIDDRRPHSDRNIHYLYLRSAAHGETTTPTQSQQSHETKQSDQDERKRRSSRGRTKTPTQGRPTRRRKEREAGRQHKTGGERAHENQRGCSSALTGAQWGSWIIRDEYLSEEMQRTPTTHTQWCRGYTTPHRATAFDATVSTKSRNKAQTTRQAERKATKPHTGHRYLEGGTSNNPDQAAQRGSPKGWGEKLSPALKTNKQPKRGSPSIKTVSVLGW